MSNTKLMFHIANDLLLLLKAHLFTLDQRKKKKIKQKNEKLKRIPI